jgi:hypothetical protein
MRSLASLLSHGKACKNSKIEAGGVSPQRAARTGGSAIGGICGGLDRRGWPFNLLAHKGGSLKILAPPAGTGDANTR